MEISFYNEFRRKAIHLFALTIPIGYFLLPKTPSLLILSPFVAGAIMIDIVRLRKLPLHGFLNRLLGPILRDHEEEDFVGASYILSASFLSILLFHKSVAMAAISFIILGDIAAALIGRRFGKTKIPWSLTKVNPFGNDRKSLEGSLSCLLMCLVVAMVIPQLPLWIGIIGAVTATVAEGISLPINDNFSVPLLSGLCMQLLLQM
ncbi:MAG: diacylglycerol/polyprenol kinase family protein [Candidatus Zixiibacteriota bacterium]